MNKLVSGAIGVEVVLNGSNPRAYFPDMANLRKKRIKHIDICTGTISPSDRVMLGEYLVSEAYLTITEANTQNQLIVDFPLSKLNVRGNRLFVNKIVDLQRSFVTFPGLDPETINGKVLYFVFWYDEPEVWGIIPTNDKMAIFPFEIKLKGSKTYFSENRYLYNKKFLNILLSLPTTTAFGNPGLPENAIENKYLTLKKGNLEFFQKVPLYFFVQNRENFPLRLQSIRFDFQTSYIQSMTTTEDDLKHVFFNAIIDDNR